MTTATQEARQTRHSILVVEDHADTRYLLCAILRHEGHTVHEASSADDAMAALQGGLRPDAIVTDVEMPGKLDGMGLAQHVADTWPAIALLVVSGREMGAAAAGRRLTFLRKPCPPDRLLQALREQIGDDALCGAS